MGMAYTKCSVFLDDYDLVSYSTCMVSRAYFRRVILLTRLLTRNMTIYWLVITAFSHL